MDFFMDVLLHKNLGKVKIKTSKRKIKFLQCRCWCQYFKMVQENYNKLFIGTKIQVQKIEYSLNILISIAFDFSKAKKSSQKVDWRFQIFLMVTHLLLFIHDIFYAHIMFMLHKKTVTCCTKN